MRVDLPSSVVRQAGPNGLSRLAVATGRASAEVYLHGAHVTAWQPAGAAPVIWLSRQTQFHPDKPIRGGVPLCFPWFAAHPTDAAAPMHGFARIRAWTLSSAGERDGEVHLAFVLEDDEATRRSVWPHRFRAEYRVSFGDRLAMALDVTNAGDAPFRFEAALHSYFAVGEVREVSIEGLAGTEYLDKVDRFARKRQGAEAIRFTGETDRVYLDTEATCTIHDPRLGRRVEIAKTGSRATVVWNPWSARAAAIPDFADDEWPGMVCVETAAVGAAAIALEPGSHHTMTAVVSVAPI